jgi:hypothetical protein
MTRELLARAAEPFDSAALVEKRRYVASRNAARDHWGAAELAHIDHEARWLATIEANELALGEALGRIEALEGHVLVAIRELHARGRFVRGEPICSHCEQVWPCPTIKEAGE